MANMIARIITSLYRILFLDDFRGGITKPHPGNQKPNINTGQRVNQPSVQST